MYLGASEAQCEDGVRIQRMSVCARQGPYVGDSVSAAVAAFVLAACRWKLEPGARNWSRSWALCIKVLWV